MAAGVCTGSGPKAGMRAMADETNMERDALFFPRLEGRHSMPEILIKLVCVCVNFVHNFVFPFFMKTKFERRTSFSCAIVNDNMAYADLMAYGITAVIRDHMDA
jgi:hypothetical protein